MPNDAAKTTAELIKEIELLRQRVKDLEGTGRDTAPSLIGSFGKREVPDELLTKWQRIVDLMARTVAVPAGLIMKVAPPEIEVLVSSSTEGNPYEQGERAELETGLYCETVIEQRVSLLVPDALKDPAWNQNPDIELGMVFYLGFPLQWPDGDVFGTICVLDRQENSKAVSYRELIQEFAEIIQSDLKALLQESRREREVAKLRRTEASLRLNEERLNALLHLSDMRETSEKELVEHALEEGVRLTQSGIGYLHFVAPDERTVQLHTWSKEALKHCRAEKAEHYPVNQAGLWADCVRFREPVIHNDYQSMSSKKGYPEGHSHVVRHASVPIFDGEKIVAIIGVGNKKAPYNGSDVRQLSLFANSLWDILTRKRAEAELENAKNELDARVRERTAALKMAHDTLQEAKDFAENLTETANAILVVLDVEGNIRVFNDAAQKITGYSLEDMRGRNWFETLVPKDHYPEVWEEFHRLVVGGTPKHFENPILTKHGEERHIVWQNSELIQDGRTTGTVSFGIDITERLHAEQALRASEERVRLLLDSTAEAIYGLDLDGNCTLCNPACLRLLGYDTADQLLGRNMHELIHHTRPNGAAYPMEECRIYEALQRGEGSHVDDEMLWRSDGTSFPAEYWSHPICDDGIVIGSVVTFLDITQRKAVENALLFVSQRGWMATGNKFFSSLVRFLAKTLEVDYAFVDTLVDGKDDTAQTIAMFASGEMGNNIEYSLRHTPCENVIGKSFCCYPNNVQQDFPSDELLVEMGAESYAGIPLWNSKGRPVGLIAVIGRTPLKHPEIVQSVLQVVAARAAAEIERNNTEQALRESEEKLSKVFHASHDAISITSLNNSCMLDVNEAFERIFCCTREEVVGKPDVELNLWVDWQHRDRLMAQLQEEGSLRDEEVWLQRTTGEAVLCELFVDSVDIGGVTCSITIFRDITDRRRAETELRRVENHLAHVGRLSTMGEMAASIAHEVNQPLITILNYAKASRNLLTAEAPADLENLRVWNDEIADSATHAGEIIKRLRGFARRAEPERVSIDIGDIIKESVRIVSIDRCYSQTAMQLDLSRDVPALIVDRVQVLQVLVNLLHNALEAMEEVSPAERKITIRTAMTGSFVEISVADRGVGLPTDHHLNLFDAFITTKPSGLGMGLAISKTIVESHGGGLWAEPNTEEGATFCFTLPVQP